MAIVNKNSSVFSLSHCLSIFIYPSLSQYFIFMTKPIKPMSVCLPGVPFKIFTARLGLSVRISQMHFQKIKITFNLS